MQLKRRTLLSGLAASAAVPFMSAAHAKQADADTKWDKETDVLVIGYGGAGACAAIEAHDKGSKVLIIEKMAQPGGNTAISSGGFMVPQDGPTALKYLTATYDLANSEKDDELLNTFCKEIMGVKDWMTGLKEGTELWVYGLTLVSRIFLAGKLSISTESAERSAPVTAYLISTAMQ